MSDAARGIARRALLRGGLGAATLAALPPSIARALAIPADVRSGTIEDVDHVVILMQENRGFDHYFGTLRGVRGFADPHPIPIAGAAGKTARTVWTQHGAAPDAPPISPFHLKTKRDFDLMRVAGTPHSWPDAQAAWDHGRMAHWPAAKTERAMGHYARSDMPFQFALADAFTILDGYHCSIQTGTNTNRLFLWSGTNDPAGTQGGPAIANSHDSFPDQGGFSAPYRWTTYVERLQKAGIDWRVYQDMADNFTDNPLVGFASFRAAHAGAPGSDPELRDRGVTTHGLDRLRADVTAGKLPQVSYVIATAAGSEHPGPSSPAQGAAYTADVIDALTADHKVWSRTVLLVMFDENDGLFDHVPPPAPPSPDGGGFAGASTIDTIGEYHRMPSAGDAAVDLPALRGNPYGLGPRVPCYAISPWSRGGWVNGQVFDHTSVIRFLEKRFGVTEPNISPWRRAICGDLTSAFDFARPNAGPFPSDLPDPRPDAVRAAAIPKQPDPRAPGTAEALWQEPGTRPARTLPYDLEVVEVPGSAREIRLAFQVRTGSAAVFHAYDRRALDRIPRRYTVGPGKQLVGAWPLDDDGYDLWVLGPNGFHRHFAGGAGASPRMGWRQRRGTATLALHALAPGLVVVPNAHHAPVAWTSAGVSIRHWSLADTQGWYDLTITDPSDPTYRRRLAGRVEDVAAG